MPQGLAVRTFGEREQEVIRVESKKKNGKDCGCGCVPPGKAGGENPPKKKRKTAGKK